MSKESLARLVSGLRAGSRQQLTVLRDIPDIAQTEARMGERGILWSAAFEAQCDAISLKLFGITLADTTPPEPHLEQFLARGRSPLLGVTDEELERNNEALHAWHDWQDAMHSFEAELALRGDDLFWRSRSIDVTDEAGSPLRCLPRFSRQMYVAFKGMMPGAKLTLDGSGRRAAQSAEDWGKALEAEAARFRSKR